MDQSHKLTLLLTQGKRVEHNGNPSCFVCLCRTPPDQDTLVENPYNEDGSLRDGYIKCCLGYCKLGCMGDVPNTEDATKSGPLRGVYHIRCVGGTPTANYPYLCAFCLAGAQANRSQGGAKYRTGKVGSMVTELLKDNSTTLPSPVAFLKNRENVRDLLMPLPQESPINWTGYVAIQRIHPGAACDLTASKNDAYTTLSDSQTSRKRHGKAANPSSQVGEDKEESEEGFGTAKKRRLTGGNGGAAGVETSETAQRSLEDEYDDKGAGDVKAIKSNEDEPHEQSGANTATSSFSFTFTSGYCAGKMVLRVCLRFWRSVNKHNYAFCESCAFVLWTYVNVDKTKLQMGLGLKQGKE
ncbi:hypothetical protein HK104_009075 [Borealophlyctis nickersoniae]|nr:hypothetical protein HK104_009075 [Borealophlyctis nickersoniae]